MRRHTRTPTSHRVDFKEHTTVCSEPPAAAKCAGPYVKEMTSVSLSLHRRAVDDLFSDQLIKSLKALKPKIMFYLTVEVNNPNLIKESVYINSNNLLQSVGMRRLEYGTRAAS